MSARWPYEKFRHTLHVLRLATLGDAHPFSIAQLIHARHLLVQLGGLVLYVEKVLRPTKFGPWGCRRIGQPSPISGVQRQARGKSGEAGITACTPARASCSAASLVWSREVFSTVPPSPLRPSSTLSAVNLRTSAKSAAVPG